MARPDDAWERGTLAWAGGPPAHQQAAPAAERTIVRVGPVKQSSPEGGPALFGRAAELAELHAALSAARAGHGGLHTLVGEPGIGKTHLAGAAGELAREAGDRVLWGRCWEGGGAPAYWPWIQVLRDLAEAHDDDELRAALGSGAPWVARLVPDVRLRLPDVELPPDADSEEARFALFDAVGTFLRRASRAQPIVALLDDLHVADQPSLLLLEFLARGVGDARLLLVGTYRDLELQGRTEIEGLVSELTRVERRLPLHGLREGDLAALVEHRIAGEPQRGLVRAIHEATGGNPFFIDEVLRLLLAGGGLSADEAAGHVPLPAGVREAIRRRLDPLSDGAKEVLASGAVIGRDFRLTTLAQATDRQPAELVALLDEAVALGTLEESRNERGLYRFIHVLVRDTLYEDLPVTQRAVRHKDVAEALEAVYATTLDLHLSELAHHYVLAVPIAETSRAVEYLIRAGNRSMHVLAYEDAVGCYAQALELIEPGPTQDERRCDVLLALAGAQARAGDVATARQAYFAAADVARRLGRGRRLGLAALGIGAVGLPPGTVDDEAVELLEEALRSLDDAPSELRARLLARLGVTLYWAPDERRRLELAAQAEAMAHELEDPATQVEVLSYVHLATAGPEDHERAARLDELLLLCRTTDSHETEMQALIWRVAAAVQLGDVATADEHVEAFVQLATRMHQRRWALYIPILRSLRAIMEGRFDASERLRAEAAQIGRQTPGSMAPLIVPSLLAAERWAQGRLGELADEIRAVAARHPAMTSWRALYAVSLLDADRDDEARQEVERLAGEDVTRLRRDTLWLTTVCLLAEAAARVGQQGPLVAQLRGLLAPFELHHATVPSTTFLGPVARYLGLLAAADGDDDAALAHQATAREMALGVGLRPSQVVVDLDEALVRVRRGAPGDRKAAAEALARATTLGRELGMGERVRRARDVIGPLEEPAPAGAQPTPAVTPGANGDGQASLRREGEVWTLAYAGRELRMRDGKGLRYLAELLARPGVEIHATALVTGESGAGGEAVALPADAGLSLESGDAGPLLDAQAKRQYKARLQELRDELEEAESFNDPERATRAREELDFLAQELAGAVGLGGRDRRAASTSERARVNVTRAIRSVIKRVGEHDRELEHELSVTVRTGTFCSYMPDPRRPTAWEVDRG